MFLLPKKWNSGCGAALHGSLIKLLYLLLVGGEIAFSVVCRYIANGMTSRFSIEDNRVAILLSSILNPLITFTVHI